MDHGSHRSFVDAESERDGTNQHSHLIRHPAFLILAPLIGLHLRVIRNRLDSFVGKEIDCFEPEKVLATGAIQLATLDLKKGKATLRVELVGTNAKSVGLRYMAGLDCIVLKKK